MRIGPWVTAVALVVAGAPAAAQEGAAERVTLTLERYAELLAKVRRGEAGRVSWGAGTVTVTLPGPDARSVVVAAEARVRRVGDGPAEVVLVPADAVLEEVTVDGGAATLTRVDGTHALALDGAGGTVALRYRVPVFDDGDGRGAVVPLPPIPGAALRVEGDGRTIEVTPAVGVRRSDEALTARLPATSAIALRWGGARAGHAVRRIDYTLTAGAEAGAEGVDVDATVEVDLSAARADVRLARATAALVDVREGNTPLTPRVVDGWHVARVEGRGRHALRVRFRLAVDRGQGQPQVVLHPDHAPITRIEAVVPGERTFQIEPAAPLATRVEGEGQRARTRAVAHLPPSAEVTLRWTESRGAPEQLVRANTETYQLVTLQEGVIRARVEIRYEVIRGKLHELPIRIPEDVVVYRVVGDAVEDWRTFAAEDETPRHVRVALARELDGSFGIELQLEAVAPRAEGAPLRVPVVRPMGAFRETGVVALFDGDKVGFAEAEPAGYTRVGQDALPPDIRQRLTDKVSQAFKHIGAPGPIASAVATARAREVRFDAHVETLYRIRDGALTGNAAVLVEIKSGRRDALVVSLPEGVAEPRITAPCLNKVEAADDADVGAGRKGYHVRFTQALEGAVQLDVEFEMLLPKELGRIRVPDVRVHGAEVEDGSLGVVAETGIEVEEAATGELRRVAIEELPKAVRLRSDREVLLGYHYAHPPWSLELDVRRHRTVETLKAAITRGWLQTHVLETGRVVSRATFEVANEDRPFLQLAMPDDSRLLTAAADGRRVDPIDDGKGAIKIPLPRGRKLLIDVTYEVTGDALGVVGGLALAAPRPDLRASDWQWLLRLPARYTVFGLDTRLDERGHWNFRPPERGGDATPVPVDLPAGDLWRQRLFTYAVSDPTEPPLAIELSYAAAAPDSLEGLLYLLGLGLLSLLAWRRGSGLALAGADWALLAGGVLLLVVQSALGELTPPEAVGAAAVVAVAALAARRRRRRAAGEAA